MENRGKPKNYSVAGTDIEEVKRQNANSGLSYTEALELIAKTGGIGTHLYSGTDVEAVKRSLEH